MFLGLECFPIIRTAESLVLLELYVLSVVRRVFDLRVVYRCYMQLCRIGSVRCEKQQLHHIHYVMKPDNVASHVPNPVPKQLPTRRFFPTFPDNFFFFGFHFRAPKGRTPCSTSYYDVFPDILHHDHDEELVNHSTKSAHWHILFVPDTLRVVPYSIKSIG
jgi:hypothetical protein